MKKGFTLIELLAVIVILAIIALIATPIVLDIITDSKASAKERSIENIEKAAKLYVVSEYETKNESAPSVITIGELKSKGYIQNTDEDDNNKVFVYMNDTDYIFYYEGRDSIGDYKTLKSLIESDPNHIKKNVVVNGNTVNKVYGTKEEQLTMNNYVLYSGQLWEVIETNDTNNTIKLVSPVSLTSITYGETNEWNSSWIKKWLNEYFYSKLERTDLIKETEFCIDPVDVTPDSYTKMTTCTNKVTEKVGLLTYEDYIYAKDASTIQDGGSYLDERKISWLITPNNNQLNYIWKTGNTDSGNLILLTYSTREYGQGVRPVISIKDNVLVKDGKGTRANPYILSSERSLKENTKLNLGKVGDYIYLDESNNPYVTEINETYVNKVSNKTSTSKVRYRIVEINNDGSVKVERADVLKNLPDKIAKSTMYIPFYSIDTGESSTSCLYSPEKKYGEDNMTENYYLGGCVNHNRFDLMEGEGDFEINTGENLPYYLNNATNSFYNWYSDKTKSMIILTDFKIKKEGIGKDYSALEEDGEVTLNVGLPSWGEMYTGSEFGVSYWYLNSWDRSDTSATFIHFEDRACGYWSSILWAAVRPVVTLSSSTYVTSGNGTVNSPYSLDI